jgi:hypothetical protein|nr:MAG TPA: hypothetical protein [Caudoviricetes sp.]
MDAVEFYKSMKRMCYSGEMCEKCPLYNNFSEMGSVCDVLLHIEDEKASRVKSIVKQWAKDHPVKTRKSEFLKMFPNADMQKIYTLFPCVMDQTIRPTRCVKYESFSSSKKCAECRKDYWNEEVTDND